MMFDDLQTPAYLLDMDILRRNLKNVQALANGQGKQLWPMTKTHKSLALARLQREAGAAGFLSGTLDEAEALLRDGLGPVMLAYPVMGRANLARLAEMTRLGRLILSVDSMENARALNDALLALGGRAEVLLIIDTGIHRLGVSPDGAEALAREITANLRALKLAGLSSHPGHAYSAPDEAALMRIAQEDGDILHGLRERIGQSLSLPLFTASGCTPCLRFSAYHPGIDILRPGVYPFQDAMQVSFGSAQVQDCALSVLGSVIARHENRLILNIGSKCLGLDKGAHGVSSLNGHGIIMGHPELILAALSEEVGRAEFAGECGLMPGDFVRVIPNHACPAANLTQYLIGFEPSGHRQLVEIDMRGNSRKPSLPEETAAKEGD